jgi:hypothetical protein
MGSPLRFWAHCFVEYLAWRPIAGRVLTCCRYDATGRTAENAFTEAEDMGWDSYFESLFQRIDRKVLDDDKAKYQGASQSERPSAD